MWGWEMQYWSWRNYGSFLNATGSVGTRFVVEDDGRAFGGSIEFPVATEYTPSTWDYWTGSTHYWGYENLWTTSGANAGSTTP